MEEEVKIVDLEEISEEKEIVPVDDDRQNELFFSKISEERLKSLASVIYQCVTRGKSINYICSLLGLTPSQVKMIQETEFYLESVHTLVEDDKSTVRDILRAHTAEVAEALLEQCKNGNVKAMSEFFKQLEKNSKFKDERQAAMDYIRDVLSAAGIKDKTERTREAIEASRKNSEPIDVEYEEIDDEEEDIELEEIEVEELELEDD